MLVQEVTNKQTQEFPTKSSLRTEQGTTPRRSKLEMYGF